MGKIASELRQIGKHRHDILSASDYFMKLIDFKAHCEEMLIIINQNRSLYKSNNTAQKDDKTEINIFSRNFKFKSQQDY